ncbi:hypothetical protein AB0M46_06225 [Dactylosporangium sp. NPDC051485]|uniref:hypothetical protein n=1 Tax=Dactylosporangium sp. NPDC051485 TaxID=3154846 RepID=UPI003429EC8B
MAERDPLRERFDAFRDQSMRAARPPGPESIPGVLRRRKRRRLTAVAVAVAAVLALAVLPTLGNAPRPPDPSISDTPAPIRPSAPTSAPPTTIITTTAGPPGAQAGGPATSTTAKPSKCATPPDGAAYGDPYVYGSEVLNGVPYSIRPADYFDQCPAYRLRFVEARYVWDRNRQLIVLASTTERYLTKASPTVPAPNINTLPTPCGEGYVALQTTKPIPSTIPNSVQDTPSAYLNLLQKHATAAFSFWHFPTSTENRNNPSCTPSPSTPQTSPTP